MIRKRQTTLKGIADKLNVSATTVSRVLSGQAKRYRISKKTETAVLEEAKRLDFSPNQLASALRLKRTHTIGLVIPDISNPFFASLVRHVDLEARKSGYAVFLCDSEERTDIEIASLKLMQSHKVDGIITSPVGQSSEHLSSLYQEGLPIVVVDRYFPQMNLPFVTSDNFDGALQGVSYLLENGHKHIACIQGLPTSTPNVDRVNGYKAALVEHHIKLQNDWIVGNNFSRRNGYVSSKLLLKCMPRPTALFSVGNQITLGILQAINEEGLKVPDDISLVSFDEQPYSAFLSTPMTTIAQQNETMGQIAVSLLLGQIEATVTPQCAGIQLPTQLIKRQSVKMI
ncbi:MAG: LacI family DNA-binding transcriptional regulator [Deltaproteobacteria bacterium]|nr:LacI family DNA-binding transcriptional regulator [Deltaproteobacteria bacterium]